MDIFKRLKILLSLTLIFLLSACTDSNESVNPHQGAQSSPVEQLIVYKSPKCGCCKKWINHLEDSGFDTEFKHPGNLDAIKGRYQVPRETRSCHTAVSKQGFVFEGHIPARYIQQFLASPPEGALGLAVPAMPVGSPGMEVNDRFMPYQVLLLKKDGSTEVFAAVESAAQQYDEAGQP